MKTIPISTTYLYNSKIGFGDKTSSIRPTDLHSGGSTHMKTIPISTIYLQNQEIEFEDKAFSLKLLEGERGGGGRDCTAKPCFIFAFRRINLRENDTNINNLPIQLKNWV